MAQSLLDAQGPIILPKLNFGAGPSPPKPSPSFGGGSSPSGPPSFAVPPPNYGYGIMPPMYFPPYGLPMGGFGGGGLMGYGYGGPPMGPPMGFGFGGPPICPAETWTFCSRMARKTSPAVRPRDAIFGGSSQTRMA